MKKILPVLIILLLTFGCVHNIAYNKDFILKQIGKWNNFIIKGIIRINYKNFTFSSNIKIDKTPSLLTISAYKGGIFGAHNQLLFHAKIDTVIHIDKKFTNAEFPKINIETLNNFVYSAKQNIDNISRFKVFSSEDYAVSFTDNFELDKIKYKEFSIVFNYLNTLKSIKIYKDKKEIIIIEIDELEFR